MKNLNLILVMLLPLCICTESFGQRHSRYVAFFEETQAYQLAKAVEKEDLQEIERLVKEDSSLLEETEPEFGLNVLVMCLYVERIGSLKKLLELGADPNFINTYNHHSVLIDAIKWYERGSDSLIDNRYAELLLKYGADPTHAVENRFTNKKGYNVLPDSPLLRASGMSLDMVKTLIAYGADPHRKLGKKQLTPFRAAILGPKYDIIYYFIDTLEVNVHQPLSIRSKDSIFVQDYVVRKKMYQIIRAEEGSVVDTVGYENRWALKKYLESKGVDFVNYKYKFFQGK